MLSPCLTCGHPAEAHVLVDLGTSYRCHDGAMIHDVRRGACRHDDDEQFCWCELWDPDTLPRVTELLGLDVRRVIVDV